MPLAKKKPTMADSSSSEESSEEDMEVAKIGKTAKVCIGRMFSGGGSALLRSKFQLLGEVLFCFVLSLRVRSWRYTKLREILLLDL